MSKFCALTLLLVASAVATVGPAAECAAGDWWTSTANYQVVNKTFDTAYDQLDGSPGVFYFDMIVSGLPGPTLSAGMSVGSILGGTTTGITSDAELMRYRVCEHNVTIPNVGTFLVKPPVEDSTDWAWRDPGNQDNESQWDANAEGTPETDPAGNLALNLTLDGGDTVTVNNGDVVCRVFYAWNGTGSGDPADVDVTLGGGDPARGAPFLLTDTSGVLIRLVEVPEPATVALLGIGLGVLLVRRKRA